MTVKTGKQDKDINDAYDDILRLLGCLTLFTVANLIKRLFAKVMSLKFHQTSSHRKTEIALRKEHFLKALLRPRMKARKDLQMAESYQRFKSMVDLSQLSQSSSRADRRFKYWGSKQRSTSSKDDTRDESHSRGMAEDADNSGFPIKIQVHDTTDSSNGRRCKLQASQEVEEPQENRPFPTLVTDNSDIDDPIVRANVLNQLTKLEHYIRKTSLQVAFRDELNRMEKSDVTSDIDVKRAAYYLYWNLKSDINSHIKKENLEAFLHPSEIDEAFDMLDVDRDNQISIHDCVQAVRSIYQERKNLALTLRDARSINKSLELLIGIGIHLLFIFLYLWVFDSNNVGQVR